MAVSIINQCQYCSLAHESMASMVGANTVRLSPPAPNTGGARSLKVPHYWRIQGAKKQPCQLTEQYCGRDYRTGN